MFVCLCVCTRMHTRVCVHVCACTCVRLYVRARSCFCGYKVLFRLFILIWICKERDQLFITYDISHSCISELIIIVRYEHKSTKKINSVLLTILVITV
jgi:hypothetical protein